MLNNILKNLRDLLAAPITYNPNRGEESMTMAPQKINCVGQAGLALIKGFEGLRLQAYKCPAGVWTIGYGHTGSDVTPGLAISSQQAEDLLKKDLTRFENAVFKLVSVTVTQNQFDALVSFCYNLGEGALGKSTLLKLLNAGDAAAAADQFLKWDKAGGKTLAGLTRRRVAERDLFMGGGK
jgi:lysozyme